MAYVVERVSIGILKQQETTVARMPRARFLELVDEVLGRYPELRGKLRPVAEGMETFPLGDWIHVDRGCGCVVGEYLVATTELGRAELARRRGSSLRGLRIDELLGGDPHYGDLIEFGHAIDARVKQELRQAPWTPEDPCATAVLIEDAP